MSNQLCLFQALQVAPPVISKYGAWGHGFPIIRVEIGQYDDGRWMWATDIYSATYGHGYKLDPKWHNFAKTRRDAVDKAREEVATRLNDRDKKAAKRWLEGLA